MIFLTRLFTIKITALLLIWMTAVICLNALAHLYELGDPVVAVITHPLTLEFIFGVAIGVLSNKNVAAFAMSALFAGAIIFAIDLSLFGDVLSSVDDRNWRRAILVGMPCASIVYGLVGIEVRSKLTAPHWLVVLGNASYSIYLSHVLVLSAIGRGFAMIPDHNVYSETAFVIICIGAANIVGLVSYSLIERRRHGQRRGRRKDGRALGRLGSEISSAP